MRKFIQIHADERTRSLEAVGFIETILEPLLAFSIHGPDLCLAETVIACIGLVISVCSCDEAIDWLEM